MTQKNSPSVDDLHDMIEIVRVLLSEVNGLVSNHREIFGGPDRYGSKLRSAYNLSLAYRWERIEQLVSLIEAEYAWLGLRDHLPKVVKEALGRLAERRAYKERARR